MYFNHFACFDQSKIQVVCEVSLEYLTDAEIMFCYCRLKLFLPKGGNKFDLLKFNLKSAYFNLIIIILPLLPLFYY